MWDNRVFVITTAHTEDDFKKLTTAFRESLAEMRAGGFLPTEPPISTPRSDTDSEMSADEPFPLTEAQKEIWVAAQMGSESHRPGLPRLPGDDPFALQCAQMVHRSRLARESEMFLNLRSRRHDAGLL